MLKEIKRYEGYSEEVAASILFQIEIDGEAVGAMTVNEYKDGTALVERIDIVEERRNNGFGSAALREISQQYDATYIVPDSEDAARLYDRLGSETTEEPWTYLDEGFGVYEI